MANLSEQLSKMTLGEEKGRGEEREEEEESEKPKSYRTAMVYDSRMLSHCNERDASHPECPQRISRIWEALEKCGYVSRCLRVQPRDATRDEILSAHTKEHLSQMERISELSRKEIVSLQHKYNSIYLNKHTFPSAMLCAGCVVELTEHVLAGKARNGIAVVRPPGHHAEADCCMGFCIFNFVAIAAKVALERYGVQRVLIVDWDVHHGNATQHMFYDDKRVLYFSLHRFDNGMFFPGSEDASHTFVGGKGAEGFNINVAWSGGPMGDDEYIAAFHHVLLPVAYEFNPDLVIVSSGLDAARGDPLGGYDVSPECYAHMTHLLTGLANGRVVIALEGGYNLTSISDSMCACAGALLGDPLPRLELSTPNPRGMDCIRDTIQAHAKYWKFLQPCEVPDDVQPDGELVPVKSSLERNSSGRSSPEDRFSAYESTPPVSCAGKGKKKH